jgi:class 3 adenylate cyclase
VRAMLRIKQLHDQLDEWNRTLAQKVQQQVAELERMNRLKRYLSPQIAQSILADEEDLFKTHRREITIVFLDLRGFTAFSDNAEPEEVMDFLRAYHAEMGQLVFKFDGTLERFMGDGVVVIFNDPIRCADHTQKAVQMTIEMRDRVKELRKAWLKKGYDLDLGVGLAAGYATLGTVGFESRMDYGTVGNLPNLAARLCAEARGGQILTDQKTMTRIDELFEAEMLPELQLKGISRPVVAYNIVHAK